MRAKVRGAELYFDFAHLTAEGNRVVGERFAQEVETALELGPKR